MSNVFGNSKNTFDSFLDGLLASEQQGGGQVGGDFFFPNKGDISDGPAKTYHKESLIAQQEHMLTSRA